MNIDLTELFALVITIVCIIISKYLIPWLKAKIVSASNDDLNFWLDFAVRAAEEKYKAATKAGGIKFTYAKELLEKQGFTYDEETMSALIDGKVRELFNWGDYSNTKAGGTE